MDQEETEIMEGNADESANETDQNVEKELEEIKARILEMEDEAEKIRQIQSEADKQMNIGSPPGSTTSSTSIVHLTIEEKMEADTRSVYVGNVDYGATAEELEQHFHGCGAVVRVTIQYNKFGLPKGFAFIEFSDGESIGLAMALDETLFRGRQLKVMPKRTNKPVSLRPKRQGRGPFSFKKLKLIG